MTKMTSNEIVKLLDNLIGPVEAVGASHVDAEILQNVRTTIDVTCWLLDGLLRSAGTRHRPEASMREIGETAYSALLEYADWIKSRSEVLA